MPWPSPPRTPSSPPAAMSRQSRLAGRPGERTLRTRSTAAPRTTAARLALWNPGKGRRYEEPVGRPVLAERRLKDGMTGGRQPTNRADALRAHSSRQLGDLVRLGFSGSGKRRMSPEQLPGQDSRDRQSPEGLRRRTRPKLFTRYSVTRETGASRFQGGQRASQDRGIWQALR